MSWVTISFPFWSLTVAVFLFFLIWGILDWMAAGNNYPGIAFWNKMIPAIWIPVLMWGGYFIYHQMWYYLLGLFLLYVVFATPTFVDEYRYKLKLWRKKRDEKRERDQKRSNSVDGGTS